MKKFIINFATTALLFFYFFNFNINVASAQKIVCEIKKDQHGGEVFLFKYDNNNHNEGYIWVYIFAVRDLSNTDRQFLEQINGQSINEEDSHYNRILNLTNTLHELDYNPLMSVAPTMITELNTEIFGILRSFSTSK